MTDVEGILRREIGLPESTIAPSPGGAALLDSAGASASSDRREAANDKA
jgi:hypothetical protein